MGGILKLTEPQWALLREAKGKRIAKTWVPSRPWLYLVGDKKRINLQTFGVLYRFKLLEKCIMVAWWTNTEYQVSRAGHRELRRRKKESKG